MPKKFNKFQEGTASKIIRVFTNPICLLGIVIFLITFFSKSTSIKEEFSFLKHVQKTQKIDNTLFLKQESSKILEIPQTIVLQKNTFKETSPVTISNSKTLGALASDSYDRKEIIEYAVGQGETLSQIAEKFKISLETILWANDLTKTSKIQAGQKLIILPVSGTMHMVKKGETLSQIALLFKADMQEILEFNEISQDDDIFAGDILVIPGGKEPVQATFSYAPMASNYFILPLPPPCSITQGLHWYNAVDFSNGKCGDLVFAVAGGEVQRTGYDSTAGNYVRIMHPNGVVTFYGHLSAILKTAGQQVSQGEIIGYVGNTGLSTGCHLHFDVRGARNPFAR